MVTEEIFRGISSFYKSKHTSSRNIDNGDTNALDEWFMNVWQDSFNVWSTKRLESTEFSSTTGVPSSKNSMIELLEFKANILSCFWNKPQAKKN